MKNFKRILGLTLALVMVLSFTACTEAERVSYNVSKRADNFNIVRQITVINCIKQTRSGACPSKRRVACCKRH